jgi:hypothetical protein
MKEMKRVASFSLTEAGYQALLTLEKRTKKTRKEVVSSSLTAALGTTLSQPVITFQLPSPEEVMFLRTEILNLECSADDLIKALFGLRPKDKDQSKHIAGLITQIQDHIKDLRVLDRILSNKQHLLKSLSASDYKLIPKLIDKAEEMKVAAFGKHDSTSRLARAEVLLKLLRIVV